MNTTLVRWRKLPLILATASAAVLSAGAIKDDPAREAARAAPGTKAFFAESGGPCAFSNPIWLRREASSAP